MNVRWPLPKRLVSAAWLIVAGGALCVAVWVSGETQAAGGLAIFYLITAAIAYALSGGSGDVAAIMRTDGDERQRRFDHDAMRYSAWAMTAAGVIGSMVQIAQRQDPGGYAVVLTVGGLTYVASLALLMRRG